MTPRMILAWIGIAASTPFFAVRALAPKPKAGRKPDGEHA